MRLVNFLIGASFGAVARYLVVTFFRTLTRFPSGILIVNVLGSFLFGIVSASKSDLAFAIMGFCGAFTTWSTFALDLNNDLKRGNSMSFLANLFLNYGLGIGAALCGLWIAG